jgi:hypothetical protein
MGDMGWYGRRGLVWAACAGMGGMGWYDNGVKWYQTSPLYSVLVWMAWGYNNGRFITGHKAASPRARSRVSPGQISVTLALDLFH